MRLICDSDCELWFTQVEKLGIDCISMPYTVGDKEYFYDLGKDTDFASFYRLLRSGVASKTSAINPEGYVQFLEPIFSAGEDVLYVSFSHKMSGTFEHLKTAEDILKKKYPERKITTFDTNSISLGAGIQVEEATKLYKAGKSLEEILTFLQEFTNKICVYFVVDDLMHLKRGGRLSSSAAFAGTLLGLKPILTFDEHGGLKVIAKTMGKNKAILDLASHINNEVIDDELYNCYIIDADCGREGDRVAELVRAKHPKLNVVRQIIGPVIGSHCGPGTLGVIYVGKVRPIPLSK
ncbi:MAG: DegV family protein [Clostridia bacterium]